MTRLLSRDPFARVDLVRENVEVTASYTCDWCGRAPRTRKDGSAYLYRYSNENDNGRRGRMWGLFCSVDCCRAYNA
jgi:hypothetical protein